MNAIALLVLVLGAAAPGQDDKPLAEGNPPLTQPIVDTWCRLVEFAFDASLSAEQKQLLQKQLVARWPEADNRARDEVLRAPAAWEQVSGATGPRRVLMQLELREAMLAAAEADKTDPANKLLLEVRDTRNPVLADGDPPLRRTSAQALGSLLGWLTSRALGQDVQLTEAQRSGLVAALVEEYPDAAPGDRTLLAGMEAVVAWLQLEWDQASPEARARFSSNVADQLGVARSFLPAPYAGEVDTWRQPDGVFEVSYPRDWPARYAALAAPLSLADWALGDVTVLGEAPGEALNLAALPTAGALLMVAALPEPVRQGKTPLGEGVVALSGQLLSQTGQAEPVAQSAAGANSVLLAWRHTDQTGIYSVWVSAVVLPDDPGSAVVILTRAPVDAAAQYEPAFSRIIHSLRLGPKAEQAPVAETADPAQVARDLLSRPLGEQMNLVEGLSKGIK